MVELHVEFDPQTKAINVRAPQDLVLALGMIEAAKAAIIRNAGQAERPRIAVPRVVMPNLGGSRQ